MLANAYVTLPAVDHNRTRVWWVDVADAPQEHEEGGGVIGHSMVWPGSELELSYFSPFQGTSLRRSEHTVNV